MGLLFTHARLQAHSYAAGSANGRWLQHSCDAFPRALAQYSAHLVTLSRAQPRCRERRRQVRAARLQRALDLLSGKDPDDGALVAGAACRLGAEQGAALDAVMALVRLLSPPPRRSDEQ